MIVYCISGLGADERVFARLSLQAEIRHIRWIKPFANESLSAYTQRLGMQVDTSRPFVLLGVSFGGLIARELSQWVPARRLILISTFSAPEQQLPRVARTAFARNIVRMLPQRWLKPPRLLMGWLFGVENNTDRRLLYQILDDTDPYFLRWALLRILDLAVVPEAAAPVLQLHGTWDRLIPDLAAESVVEKVHGAGHLMIYTHAAEVSKCINSVLAGS